MHWTLEIRTRAILSLAALAICMIDVVGVSARQGTALTLTVRVYREGTWSGGTGSFVDGASVCVGTERKVTPPSGTVTFQVPARQTATIVAFKSGFVGASRPHLMGTYNATVNIGLSVGSGGPMCGGTQPSSTNGPAVTDFKINKGDTSTTSPEVVLNFSATGSPVEMRHALGATALSTSYWRTFTNNPLVAIGGSGPNTYSVYFQVRDSAGRVSTPANDSIQLVRSIGGGGGGGTTIPPPAPADLFGWATPNTVQADVTKYSLPAGALAHHVSEIVPATTGAVIVRSDGNACTTCHKSGGTSPNLVGMSQANFCNLVQAFRDESTKPQNLKNFFKSWKDRNCP